MLPLALSRDHVWPPLSLEITGVCNAPVPPVVEKKTLEHASMSEDKDASVQLPHVKAPLKVQHDAACLHVPL